MIWFLFAAWWLIGTISMLAAKAVMHWGIETSLRIDGDWRRRPYVLTRGSLAWSIFIGLGGPICTVALLIVIIVAGLMIVSSYSDKLGWAKQPIFRRRRP